MHKRKVNKIIIHCSAHREGANRTIEDIRVDHIKNKKYNDVGYHYVIHLDGSIHKGRDEWVIGAHTYGHNYDSIGVCYVGGVDENMIPKDTRTEDQRIAFEKILVDLKGRYPNAKIYGHYEFSNKACPSFNVKEYKEFYDSLSL